MKATLHVAVVGCFALGLLAFAGCGDAKTDSGKSKSKHVHGDEDKLMWGDELIQDGFKITLGWHGEHIHAGEPDEPLEPAAMITKDGKAVADAVVSVSLLDKDKKEIVKKVATEYEAADEGGPGEPAHYAQGRLDVPAGTTKAFIRFHIKLPGVTDEFISEVEIAPHADED
jgi:hypothetical protein